MAVRPGDRKRRSDMKQRMWWMLGAGALLGGVAMLPSPSVVRASSHREAPAIADDPAADATDLYVFRSPTEDSTAADTLTIIANYWPMEEPGGGPNFPRFSQEVLYEVKIDNDGDAREDINYQ